MSLPQTPELARLIVTTIKAYAILVLTPQGEIVEWLGDAEAITGYAREEAVGRNFDLLFTESDLAADAARAEIAVALREGRAEDSRWHLHKEGRRFWANGMTLKLDGLAPYLMKIFRDETPAKKAEEQRILLLNELNHRVKNTFALLHSVVDQTLRAAKVEPAVRTDIAGRIAALSGAHNVLMEQSWAGADLDTLVRDVARPFDRRPSPFIFDGPWVRLHPSQALTLSLALHELATNAMKYGALSQGEGRVALSWNLAHNGSGERYLTLFWKERGGPSVAEPSRTGFGSRLIRQAFGDHEGGHARLSFSPEGVTCLMSMRLIDTDEKDAVAVNGAAVMETASAKPA